MDDLKYDMRPTSGEYTIPGRWARACREAHEVAFIRAEAHLGQAKIQATRAYTVRLLVGAAVTAHAERALIGDALAAEGRARKHVLSHRAWAEGAELFGHLAHYFAREAEAISASNSRRRLRRGAVPRPTCAVQESLPQDSVSAAQLVMSWSARCEGIEGMLTAGPLTHDREVE